MKFSLELPRAQRGDRRFTTGSLAIGVDGETIWPVPGAENVSLDIQVDDLLSYFTEFWKPLALRQTYPTPAVPNRPMRLRDEAEKRWEDAPFSVAEREDALIGNFEEAHNLSLCFAGYFELPPLWLLRNRDRMIVDSRAGMRAVPFDSAWLEISRVGNQIAEHLSLRRHDRWSNLLDRWRRRDRGDPNALLAWATSLNYDVAAEFAAEGLLSTPDSVADAANDNDELRVAARMASALPSDQIRRILQIVRGFAKGVAPKLDILSEATSTYIASTFATRRAYEQGEAAARFVRDRYGLRPDDRFEIFDALQDLGVEVDPRSVEPWSLRALAVWGNAHGPAVLLNVDDETNMRNIDFRGKWSARVTLAHELCHLLLDHGHALSAVEVLNSRMPLDIERRAKSFAGELLLPYEAAAEAWRRAGAPTSLEGLRDVIERLQESHGVSLSVTAWKLEHGLQREDIDLSLLLESIAPNR